MTLDQMQALLAAYEADADFKAAIDGAESVDAVLALASARGFEITEADFGGSEADRDLTDEDLEASSGGTIAPTRFTCLLSIACVMPSMAIC